MSNIQWVSISEGDQISEILSLSKEQPCLIFKHSTSCSISSMAKMRLESAWDFKEEELKAFFLDLISYRSVSNQIANDLQVHHESPQIILVDNGEVVLDASHLDCTVDEIRSVYNPA